MSTAAKFIDRCITLTGISVMEAFKKLNEVLPNPEKAYKKIEGGRGGQIGLTDINPGFLPEVLLECFGPIGLGWGYKVVEKDLKQESDKKWLATAVVHVWYTYVLDGEVKTSQMIEATGGSDNGEPEWAMKGSVTNALGMAWFFAGYQIEVYKGLRSHSDYSAGSRTGAGATAGDNKGKVAQDTGAQKETPKPEEKAKETPPADQKTDAAPPAAEETKVDGAAGKIVETLKAGAVHHVVSGNVIYAKFKFGETAKKAVVTKLGGTWDKEIPAEKHGFDDKAGCYIIKAA